MNRPQISLSEQHAFNDSLRRRETSISALQSNPLLSNRPARSKGSESELHNLHTWPAFNFWKTKGAEKLYSLLFQNILTVSVAYTLAAAPSAVDGRTCLPFCTSHTHGWLSLLLSLCPCVCLSHTKKKKNTHTGMRSQVEQEKVLQRRSALF